MASFNLGMLSDQDIELAMKLDDAQKICEQIIKPQLNELNKKIGQDNDPKYLAYCVMHITSKLG